MKVLIYDPFILWYHHFVTGLEIALEHINQNDEVHFLACNAELSYCEVNPQHLLELCTHCNLHRNRGLELINLPQENLHDLALRRFKKKLDLPKFETLDQLK